MKKYGNEQKIKKRTAYHPKPPFRIVEGVGTAPFNRLDPFAQWVLLKFYSKFTGFNRSDLSLTYAEVGKIMSGAIYSRALWKLIGFGFLDVRRWGKLERNCSLFGLSDRWRRFCENDGDKLLDKIDFILQKVEVLKREIWPKDKKSEKRQRIAALRHSILKG